ncbi:MAG: hypothetical protein IK048_03945 [Clostridia bacterium]|nr:hypothetical protein [Clostridia bacterium]
MAYKIAYIKSNKFLSVNPATEFANFAKSNGVDFCVETINASEISSVSHLNSFDAVVVGSFSDVAEKAATDIAKKLNLYAKCAFKPIKNSRSAQKDVVLVTDVAEETHDEFAFNKDFGRETFDTLRYSELEIERTARIAYELAETRNGKLTLADTSAPLKTANLWRKIVSDINEDYLSVHLDFERMYTTASKLSTSPCEYDVILAMSTQFDALSGVLDTFSPLGDGTATVAYLGETTVGVYGTERPATFNRYFDFLAIEKMLEHSFDLPALNAIWKDQIGNLTE